MSTAAAAPLTPKPATARETIVEFKDVWKRYGNKEILAGVNLTISRGEIVWRDGTLTAAHGRGQLIKQTRRPAEP